MAFAFNPVKNVEPDEHAIAMNSQNKIHIVHLKDNLSAIPILTQWFIEEWAPWYGPEGPGDAKQDLEECCRQEGLPICLIAFNESKTVLGTVALKSKSIGSKRSDGPWMSALLVSKSHRGKGVGTALIEAIEKEARRLDFTSVYCSTNTAEGTLQHRGWKTNGKAETLRGSVYRLKLS